jgi:hypothetical protein
MVVILLRVVVVVVVVILLNKQKRKVTVTWRVLCKRQKYYKKQITQTTVQIVQYEKDC